MSKYECSHNESELVIIPAWFHRELWGTAMEGMSQWYKSTEGVPECLPPLSLDLSTLQSSIMWSIAAN
jgi:hypothetical protein